MNPALIRLLQLSDPALPVGGFSHSAGLETYVQLGIVKDTSTAEAFVRGMLSQNIHFTDAALVSLACDAVTTMQLDAIRQLDDLCTAVKLPKEMRLASQKLGVRLIKIFQPVCNNELLNQYATAIQEKKLTGHYCIAFGIIAGALQISKADALTGFYYNAAAGFVTNSVKLVPLSQQAGQELLFSLQPLIIQLVQSNLQPDKEMIGVCCPGFDIRSMQHEQLYSRLYMS
ncbi:urease accessory protein UreF [Niastella koreensis]|uniref:Urease accessory protein UreF n=2 Tax=Niastella koreensis TaxID=354356 RepID=G8T6J9_NIAKG|nr:urease accessory protein UreF [Niastella koreensis]AEV96844.1 Urease accessory protein ureF [Niastella koreensis GR20-10]OQP49192.1 urease accessory protein UreF [Niastella koreensis]